MESFINDKVFSVIYKNNLKKRIMILKSDFINIKIC